MSNPLVTINLVVLNGEKYIRHCLDGISAQTYPHELIEFNILDNGSTDNTREIIKDRLSFDGFDRLSFESEPEGSSLRVEDTVVRKSNHKLRMPKFLLLESSKNFGMWPGQEELLKNSNGKYILAMAVDVILDKDFIKNSVEMLERDNKIGALQAKIYKYDLSQLHTTNYTLPTTILDTCGFQIYKSRRIINIGHGATWEALIKERPVFAKAMASEVFGVEGACPFFRKEALESCCLDVQHPNIREIFDHDFFWYGDDLDISWRMNLFGWKQVFTPSIVAWHDRQTTKNIKKKWYDYITRLSARRRIPIKKRRLDWRNTRFTIIKNDYIINILKDLPYILAREIGVLGYTLLFEPKVLLEWPSFLRLLPRMIKKRREVMKKAVISPGAFRRWFK